MQHVLWQPNFGCCFPHESFSHCHLAQICFASSNFQEQGSLNATTKQIKFQELLVSFLVGVFNTCRLCVVCIFGWGGVVGLNQYCCNKKSSKGKV